MTILESCAAAVWFRSLRKLSISSSLALYGLFIGGLYMQQSNVGFGLVGNSTATYSILFRSGQMYTLLCGRSLIAISTPPCLVLWLQDGLSLLWIW